MWTALEFNAADAAAAAAAVTVAPLLTDAENCCSGGIDDEVMVVKTPLATSLSPSLTPVLIASIALLFVLFPSIICFVFVVGSIALSSLSDL